MAKKKRPYSFDYQAQGEPKRYLLSGIPPTLWKKFQARCKREHVAMRQVILDHVKQWTDRPEAPTSEPHVVSEGGTAEDAAYWKRRNALRAKR